MAIPAFAIGLVLLSAVFSAYLTLVVSMLWAKRQLCPTGGRSKAYEGIRVGARAFALFMMFPLISAAAIAGVEDYYYTWRSWALYVFLVFLLGIFAAIGLWLWAVFKQVQMGDEPDAD